MQSRTLANSKWENHKGNYAETCWMVCSYPLQERRQPRPSHSMSWVTGESEVCPPPLAPTVAALLKQVDLQVLPRAPLNSSLWPPCNSARGQPWFEIAYFLIYSLHLGIKFCGWTFKNLKWKARVLTLSLSLCAILCHLMNPPVRTQPLDPEPSEIWGEINFI